MWLHRRTARSRSWSKGWVRQEHSTRRDRYNQSVFVCLNDCQSGGGQGPDKGTGIKCREKKQPHRAIEWSDGHLPAREAKQLGNRRGKGYVSWMSIFWTVLDAWYFQGLGFLKSRDDFKKIKRNWSSSTASRWILLAFLAIVRLRHGYVQYICIIET